MEQRSFFLALCQELRENCFFVCSTAFPRNIWRIRKKTVNIVVLFLITTPINVRIQKQIFKNVR